MRTVERRGQIAASPGRVFAFVADLENLPRWQPGVTSARPLSGGPIRVGSVARVVTHAVGQEVEADVRVVELDAPGHLAFQTEVSGVRAVASVDVAGVAPDRSEVVVRLEISASGFARFMEPVIAGAVERELAGAVERVREALEGDRQPPAAA